jgi:hypothetical protein
MGRKDYFGAKFRDHPEWRNDGVFNIQNESVFTSLIRGGDASTLDQPEDAMIQPRHDEKRQEISLELTRHRKRRQLLFRKIEKAREYDNHAIISNLDRWHAMRETRFAKMLQSLQEDVDCVQAVNNHILREEKLALARKKNLHNQWVDQVFNPLQVQINRIVNPLLPSPTRVAVTAADPVKRELHRYQEEQGFSVATDRLLFEHSPNRPAYVKSLAYPSRGVDPSTWAPVDSIGHKRMQISQTASDAAGKKS